MAPEIWAAMIGLAVLAPAVWLYNRLVADRNLVRQGYADIDVQLKRRADLVPNLVEAVRAYAAHEAVKRAAKGVAPSDFFTHPGWVLLGLQNAFYCLHELEFEEALVQTVGRGGDTDTNAAIAGALLGACHGREAIPSRWIHPVLACRPLAEAGALRPRPMEYWPDDILEIAEAVLNSDPGS